MTLAISQPEEAKVTIEDALGSATNIEAEIQTAALSMEYDTDDAISLSDDHENHTVGKIDPGNFDQDAVYTRSRGLMLMQHWRAPNRKTFEVVLMPEGDASGDETHTFNVFMTGFEMSCDDGSTSKLNSKYKISGEVVTDEIA